MNEEITDAVVLVKCDLVPSKKCLEQNKDIIDKIKSRVFARDSGYSDEWREAVGHVDRLERLGKQKINLENALKQNKVDLKKLKNKKAQTKEEVLKLCRDKPREVYKCYEEDDKKYCMVNGKYHSKNDLPAIEYANGEKYWFWYGELHRENGPAWISSNGNKKWYANGKLHRLDGPAFELANGKKYWFIEGKKYTEEEFKQQITKGV